MSNDLPPMEPELPELPELPSDDDLITLDEIVADAEFDEIPARRTKEELIAAGLLPPDKKNAVAEAVEAETSKLEEIPVQNMLRKPPNHANALDNQHLIDKASKRGSMALDLAKVMIASENRGDVEDVVEYAFAMADAIQAEVDAGYQQDIVDQAAKTLGTS